jgi:hypothetical protein
MARLLSVNVGLPRDIAWKGRTVHTGVWKNPVTSRCRASRLNLEGDGQGGLRLSDRILSVLAGPTEEERFRLRTVR